MNESEKDTTGLGGWRCKVTRRVRMMLAKRLKSLYLK